MALTWTIGGVSITPPYGEWGYTVADIGTTIPVISGFTPAVVGRSFGNTGERGTIVHLERGTAWSEAAYGAVLTAIRAMIDTLMPSGSPGYHDAVFPDWSGRVRVTSVTPSYGRHHKAAYGRLSIQYERVHT